MAGPAQVQYQQPSLWDQMKMGILVGYSAGATIGLLYGTMVWSKGMAGNRGRYIPTVGKYMFIQGSQLGFFLGIGSLIRG